MASFRQRNNKWQARVSRNGYPDQVKTFDAKSEAERWARSVESEMDKGQFIDTQEAQRTTLKELILRYVEEVTPTMKSVNEDTIRLKAIARKPIANWSLAYLSATRVAAYRDERLKEVSNGTVIRELAYLSSIINHARREWGIGFHGFDDIASAIDQALAKFPPLVRTPVKHTTTKKFDCPETQPNIDLVKAMLSAIDPDIDYCEWRDVVWAVAATGWGCSYDLSYFWSSQGATWDEVAFNRVWDGFDDSRGIGFGTLAYHAKQAGYVGALPTNSQPQQCKPIGRLLTVCAADIQPERVEWLVDQSFPLGMMAVIGGQPGLGKSQISINLAAGVTTGKGLPGAGSFTNLGSVIILANEDDAARTIRPRLDAAGADISKVHVVQGVAREGCWRFLA